MVELTRRAEYNKCKRKREDVMAKVKFEEEYTRATIFIRNDILKRLDAAKELGGKGAKTQLVNEALEFWLKKQGY